jgi:hypothetical protein
MQPNEVIEKSIGKRTGIDFSKHEVIVTKQDGLLVHYLKKPGTICDSIRFINTCGILAVNGDYGNWIFCREFHPIEEGAVSDGYWCEKLRIASTQDGVEYSPEKTQERIRQLLAEEEELEPDEIEYLNQCLRLTDDEFQYTSYAYQQGPGRFGDGECVPLQKVLKPWLAAVFDGFDEICRRLKTNSQPLNNKGGQDNE